MKQHKEENIKNTPQASMSQNSTPAITSQNAVPTAQPEAPVMFEKALDSAVTSIWETKSKIIDDISKDQSLTSSEKAEMSMRVQGQSVLVVLTVLGFVWLIKRFS